MGSFQTILDAKLAQLALPLPELEVDRKECFTRVSWPLIVLCGEESAGMFRTLTGFSFPRSNRIIRWYFNDEDLEGECDSHVTLQGKSLEDRVNDLSAWTDPAKLSQPTRRAPFRNLQLLWLPEIHNVRHEEDKGPSLAAMETALTPYLQDPAHLVVLVQRDTNQRFVSPTAKLLQSRQKDVVTVCMQGVSQDTRVLSFEKAVVGTSYCLDFIADEVMRRVKLPKDLLARYQSLFRDLPKVAESPAVLKQQLMSLLDEVAIRVQYAEIQEVGAFVRLLQQNLESCLSGFELRGYVDTLTAKLMDPNLFATFHTAWEQISQHTRGVHEAYAKQQEFLVTVHTEAKDLSSMAKCLVHKHFPQHFVPKQQLVGIPDVQNWLVCAQATVFQSWRQIVESHELRLDSERAQIEAKRTTLESLQKLQFLE